MINKLVILEGPDSTGKSTQVEILKDLLKAKFIIQPSSDNIVGFLREIVKNDVKLEQFPRQMLHTISHIVDAFTEFNLDKKFGGDRFSGAAKNYYSNIIMDRCHASTYVYGEVTGLTQEQNDLLLKIHQSVYNYILRDFEIKIIFLDRDNRIKEKLTDKFETTFDWHDLRNNYLKFYDKLNTGSFLFSENERVFKLNTTNLSKEEVTVKLLEMIDAD